MLQTARAGRADGAPHIVLHDRYQQLADARALAVSLAPADALTISVQAPRLQTSGGVGKTAGYYWYVGPREKAELTSLGDTLYHLERLLLDETQSGKRATLIGKGEGGTVALLCAMTWPEKVAEVVAIDAALPENFDRIPIEWPALTGLAITLVAEHPHSGTLGYLTSHGANVRQMSPVEQAS